MDRRECLDLVLALTEELAGRRPHPTRKVVDSVGDPELVEELLDDLRAHLRRDMPALRKLHPSITFHELAYIVWEMGMAPSSGEGMLLPDMTFTSDERIYSETWERAMAQAEDLFPGYRASVGSRPQLGHPGYLVLTPKEGWDEDQVVIPLRALEALREAIDRTKAAPMVALSELLS